MNKTISAGIGVLSVAAVALGIIPTTREEIHWRWASFQDDTASYEAYVETWPEGRHAAEAQAQHDEHGWADARAANTIRSYLDYVSSHPQGRYAKEAEARASSLRVNAAPFDAALKTGTEVSLTWFLRDYPGHQKEDEAKQAINDIKGRDIVDLLEEKKVEIQTRGSGIQNVRVRVRRLVSYPLNVRIPAGTYFVSARKSAQNMVTTEESWVRLGSDGWRRVSVSAACANRPRDIPGETDTFTVRRSPHQQELARLMPVLESADPPFDVRQAAVWIVTDNADYGDLGILVSGFGGFGPRVIDAEDAARALMICERAGIDIAKKAIWRDRQKICDELEDGNVKTWLQQEME